MPTGIKMSVEITSIAYDAHLLSRSELISFYKNLNGRVSPLLTEEPDKQFFLSDSRY